MERLVKLEVLGHEFPLYTDAPDDEVQEILTLVKNQLEEHAQRGPQFLPSNKAAILASLNMAGKYVKLKKHFDEYRRQVDSSLDRLSEKIEKTL